MFCVLNSVTTKTFHSNIMCIVSLFTGHGWSNPGLLAGDIACGKSSHFVRVIFDCDFYMVSKFLKCKRLLEILVQSKRLDAFRRHGFVDNNIWNSGNA